MSALSMDWLKTPRVMLADPRIQLLSAAQFGLYVKLLLFKLDGFLNRLFGDTQTKDECVQKRLMLTATQAQKLKRKLQAVHLIDEDWQPLDWDEWHGPKAWRPVANPGDASLTEEEKEAIRREKNKLSQAKSRARKKDEMKAVTADVTDVTDVTRDRCDTRVTVTKTGVTSGVTQSKNSIEKQEVAACHVLLKNKDLDLRKKKKKKQKQEQKPATGTNAREAQPEPAGPLPAVESKSKSDFVFFEEAKAKAKATAPMTEPADPCAAEPTSEASKEAGLTAAAPSSPVLPAAEPNDTKPMTTEMDLHDTTPEYLARSATNEQGNGMIHEQPSNAVEMQNNASSGDLAKKRPSSRLPPVKKRTLAAYLQECKSRGVHPITTHPQVRAWLKTTVLDGRLYTLAWLCFKQRYLQAKDNKTGALITHANWPLKFLKIMEGDNHGFWQRHPQTQQYHLTTEGQQAIIAFADKNATIRSLLNYYHDARAAAEKRVNDHLVDDVPDDFDPSAFMAELRKREGNETVDNLLRMVRANPQALAQMH